MRNLAPAFPLLLIASLVAQVCGCGPSPTRSAGPRCRTVASLPGSEPLSPELLASLAASEVPTEAPAGVAQVCNRLALEPGAFARRHALDAVDWRPWSPAVLAEATRLRRPLLVLTGVAADAASRELAGDLFLDANAATDVNHGFVPVLVDRDERPDVDAWLMEAVGVLTGGGGWPAVIFVDPDGNPFEACSWGASAAACGPVKPLIDRVQRRLALGSGTFGVRAEMTAEKMQRLASIDASGPLPDADLVANALHRYLAAAFDADGGAFGEPPLFPRAPALAFLLGGRVDADARAMAVASLESLRASALFDTASGGFFRYAAGARWQAPSREKMLADNAALASVYLMAAQATGRDAFRDTARGILDFVVERLVLPGGGLAAAISADGWRDERVLADANAVAISALLHGGRLLGDRRFTAAAVAAATFVDGNLRRGGRVRHAIHVDGRTTPDGYLPDAALFGLACLDLEAAGVSGSAHWMEAAQAIAVDLEERFEDRGRGGFFLTASDAEALPLRLKPLVDAAVPGGNSAAALLLTRLAARTGTSRARAAARRTFEAFAEPLLLRPLTFPSMVSALGEWTALQASAPLQLDPAPAVHP